MREFRTWIRLAAPLIVVAALVAASSSSASFPGSNGRIAFARFEQGFIQIFTVQPAGTGLTKLSKKGSSDRRPSWSGDGKRIAYESCCGRQGNSQSQIWVMSETGTGKVNVSKSGTIDYWPAFSPDGQKIAFVRRVGTVDQIWAMNADGSGQTQLTAPPAGYQDVTPSWSPDGTMIAFQRCCYPTTNGRTGGQIFTMLAEGSTQTNISKTAGVTSDYAPDWSPDGTRIVFGRCCPGDDVYVMRADGSTQTRLTFGLSIANPKWSPDGTRIAFEGTYLGVRAIYRMTIAGEGITKVTDGFDPAWQPVP